MMSYGKYASDLLYWDYVHVAGFSTCAAIIYTIGIVSLLLLQSVHA